MKILLVEDDFYLAEQYEKKLIKEGFDVLVVNDGKDVLKVNFDEIELVLLDIMLPHLSGIDLLDKIEKPIIIMSNIDSAYVKELVARDNVKKYLVKADITPAEIVREVRKWI